MKASFKNKNIPSGCLGGGDPAALIEFENKTHEKSAVRKVPTDSLF